MASKFSHKLRLLLVLGGIPFAMALMPQQVGALDVFNSTLDKREPASGDAGARARTVLGTQAEDFKNLAKKKRVFVDLRILLDGKSKYAVLTSEETDEKRYNVDCRPGAYGRLPMGEGVEYYVQTGDESGQRIDVSVFPGSRSANPDSDVSCVADRAHPKAAVLRIRGLYRVLTNDFGDRLVVELRPITREALTPEERKKLP